jgi:hypothetical protein
VTTKNNMVSRANVKVNATVKSIVKVKSRSSHGQGQGQDQDQGHLDVLAIGH